MNIKRGLRRLAIVLSFGWAGITGWLAIDSNRFGSEQMGITAGGFIFVWICYWILTGFIKDESNQSESNGDF